MDVKSQDSSDNQAIDALVENWIAAHNSDDAEALVEGIYLFIYTTE